MSTLKDELCAQCGEVIPVELRSSDSSERKPCPKCNSTTRISLHTEIGAISFCGEAQLEVITYPQKLLDFAKDLIDKGQFSIAVVVCHMACEVATERSLSESFTNRGVQYLEDAITDMLNGFNLANPRVLNLYNALTGDEIQAQPFWQNFKKSAKCRNKIVHRGTLFGKSQAEESLRATTALITNLKK